MQKLQAQVKTSSSFQTLAQRERPLLTARGAARERVRLAELQQRSFQVTGQIQRSKVAKSARLLDDARQALGRIDGQLADLADEAMAEYEAAQKARLQRLEHELGRMQRTLKVALQYQDGGHHGHPDELREQIRALETTIAGLKCELGHNKKS